MPAALVINRPAVVDLWLRATEEDAALVSHSNKVADLTEAVAIHLGLADEERGVLIRAALLHDVGKLQLHRPILYKERELSSAEHSYVRSHAQLGYELLVRSGETNSIALSVVRDHHERLDGSGYPRGLKASQISWPVRLVSLCDVFAAMTEERPYAHPLTWHDALERIAKGDTRLDGDLARSLAHVVERSRNGESLTASSRFR